MTNMITINLQKKEKTNLSNRNKLIRKYIWKGIDKLILF